MSSNDSDRFGQEVDQLIDQLTSYERAYYQQGRSLVSDREYDRLFDRLQQLEKQYPELQRPDSPTRRVGSDLSVDLPEVPHEIPVLSLDKVYSGQELTDWQLRTQKRAADMAADSPTGVLTGTPDFICEEKIDGVSIVLYYRTGLLEQAVTRGNGRIGNDVTANIRTIRRVPLRLAEPLTVAIRGEVYLSRADFAALNATLETPFANPRNLAAGTIRRVKSSGAAAVPLQFFGYDAYGLEGVDSHHQVLLRLHQLGLPVNSRCAWIHNEAVDADVVREFRAVFPEALVGTAGVLSQFIQAEIQQRDQLAYDIDGLVAKLDDIGLRERLGYTGHHPRWAVALKFDAPQGVSTIREIDVQVGRTGRITPVARIEPVLIGGSTVQNVTLHNQEYITGLELAAGDTVSVSKRGDVIPAVEQVLEKGAAEPPVWQLPEHCPSCGSRLVVRGAHHFCPNTFGCPDQQRGRLRFFAGRDQMDIDGIGPETLETLIRLGMVQSVPDLYEADYQQLMDEAGFGERKIAQIRTGIERSKAVPYRRLLPSLGIPELGPKVTQLLCDAGIGSIDELMQIADTGDHERLSAIHGIGPRIAETVIEQLRLPELREVISRLREHGLRFVDEQPETDESVPQIFSGQTWCVTGSFEHFQPRTRAAAEIERRGGSVVSSVSGKTTHLLAGSGAGSKYDKAVSVGAEVVDEPRFRQLLAEAGS
ncbi:NAD-dependent DNA ligase LigA [Spirochaeta africana]|uniref:DNA ligase n=1 Tax=Spirochaeta africana (strain ATCC 700263 / DSM 8902 / Z-7692) TaxID=889378 RepID=H9UL59_SPIAZ|nr:NAD-dependent DNA ligase LigA [Spirochaeta africana]AFG38252.1 DNA ligase, NAD-dependent [Spirochaeta africana DSM 8902]